MGDGRWEMGLGTSPAATWSPEGQKATQVNALGCLSAAVARRRYVSWPLEPLTRASTTAQPATHATGGALGCAASRVGDSSDIPTTRRRAIPVCCSRQPPPPP